MASLCRAFQFRLHPTVKQRHSLERLLAEQRRLYNAALEERRGVWQWEQRSVTRFEQYRTLTGLAGQEPDLMAFGVTVARGTLLRLDRAFQGFFRRVRAGERAGFPRFRSARRFASVEWPDVLGWKLSVESGRIYLQGVGHVRLRMHRPIRGRPRTITVKRTGSKWVVTIFCADVPDRPLPATGTAIGVDVGITVAAGLSDGRVVDNPRHLRASADRLARAQRLASGRQRGSARRRRAGAAVGAIHRKVHCQRKDFLHKLSRELVAENDVIVIEDLPIANLLRRPKPRPTISGGFEANGASAKRGLNRSIHDSAWGTLRRMLAYKAEDAGRELIVVNPMYTSQTCSSCGVVDRANRVGTAFSCVSCRFTGHADVNAAINILRAGLALRPSARSEPTSDYDWSHREPLRSEHGSERS